MTIGGGYFDPSLLLWYLLFIEPIGPRPWAT